MIEFYFFPTPNGQKIAIFLEETGLKYEVRLIDISKGEQFKPDFLEVSPNGKIPAIRHHRDDGQTISMFESGAILEYLADWTGRFLPPLGDLRRYEVLKWLYWQVGGFGPMLGQNHHFNRYAPVKIPYAIERYEKESQRLYKVLELQLQGRRFVAGDDYSIADMAIFPWTLSYQWQNIRIDDYPEVVRWQKAMQDRPAVQRAQKTLPLSKSGSPA